MAVDRSAASGARRMSAIVGLVPGVALSAFIAVAGRVFEGLGLGPSLMIALVLGIGLGVIARAAMLEPGIEFSGKHLLAVGVALLGARLTVGDVVALGPGTALVVAASMALTFACSIVLARRLGLGEQLGVLAGCGTAVCGASAIVAAAAVLPRTPDLERDTALAVLGVVALSAVAMLAYPLLAARLGASDLAAGIIMGGAIHNVPQAVAAGYAISETAGNTAALTKLYRVSLLAPVVVLVAIRFGLRERASLSRIGVPWFVLVFAALVILGSVVELPTGLRGALTAGSSWLLLVAIAAIGLRTQLVAVRDVGPKALLLLIANSLVLALAVAAGTLALVRP